MRTPQEELKLNMTKRAAGYRKLMALAQEQQDILVSGRHDDLEDNVARHEPILLDIAALDRRVDEMETLSGRPVSSDPEMDKIKAETQESAAALRALVECNAQLLSNAAEYTRFSMNIIARMTRDRGSYDSQAAADLDKAHALMLDLRV